MTLDSEVTRRRRQVAKLLREGATYEQMKTELNVSESTITRDVQSLKDFEAICAFDAEVQELRLLLGEHESLLYDSIKVFAWFASDEEINAALPYVYEQSDVARRQSTFRALWEEAEHREQRKRRLG